MSVPQLEDTQRDLYIQYRNLGMSVENATELVTTICAMDCDQEYIEQACKLLEEEPDEAQATDDYYMSIEEVSDENI